MNDPQAGEILAFVQPSVRRVGLADMLSRPKTLQSHYHCSGFEKKLVACYESYGFRNIRCNDYYNDLVECVFSIKKQARVDMMKRERMLQYKEGTRKELYAPPPPQNSY